MSKKTLFSKHSLRDFIAILLLCIISLSGNNLFLKLNIAQAADYPIGLTRDNPGIKKAIEVQSRHSEGLMSIPGIVGHGVGILSDGEPVIKIFAKRAGIPNIPVVLEGVPTKVEVTGMVVAYDVDPTAWFDRPVPTGVSTGHPYITAGTIGCRVTDGTDVYALSNNHVYANQNDASLGDSALQPGPYDGGVDPGDAIGSLDAFVPIDFSGGNNLMDAAIALSSEGMLGCSTPGVPGSDSYGTPNSVPLEVSNDLIGKGVQKYGRTTAWTHGTVETINTTVDVCYESWIIWCLKQARFVDQIAITPGTFSDGGDSGSLIVTDDANKNPVGLLFAGSSTQTFANPIVPVLAKFGVTVDDCPGTCTDSDGDGFYAESGCGTDVDCNDGDAAINPDATEECDGVDNNCDGNIDEGCPACLSKGDPCASDEECCSLKCRGKKGAKICR